MPPWQRCFVKIPGLCSDLLRQLLLDLHLPTMIVMEMLAVFPLQP